MGLFWNVIQEKSLQSDLNFSNGSGSGKFELILVFGWSFWGVWSYSGKRPGSWRRVGWSECCCWAQDMCPVRSSNTWPGTTRRRSLLVSGEQSFNKNHGLAAMIGFNHYLLKTTLTHCWEDISKKNKIMWFSCSEMCGFTITSLFFTQLMPLRHFLVLSFGDAEAGWGASSQIPQHHPSGAGC